MQKIIGVRFKQAGKIHLFDPGDDDIVAGDFVIVETSRGLECGSVVVGVRELPTADDLSEDVPLLRRIYRKATKADLVRVEENREKERQAFEICREKIAEHQLPMNLINVRYTFDVSKIIFYFTAEGRVDFRMLVRDLAYIFRTRIELRQVGVREQAKVLGGVGCCGRKLCCTTFLGDFAQVSIRMAKEQNLSLNPAKISGVCGRLLCCLKFESEYYHECYMKNNPVFEPHVGDRVILDEGEGRVVSVNVQRKIATVLIGGNKTVTSSWEDLLPADYDGAQKFSKPDEEIPNEDEEKEIEPPQETKPSTTKFSGAKSPRKKFVRGEDSAKGKDAADSADERNKMWINRPRKPRRPKGNFRS
ncbi:MAG: stage 0 sporulation family protein [Selenomonadaceae bacterium]|nr:stage 0 sporulation family protein [Selenomonadaceae bacterium]